MGATHHSYKRKLQPIFFDVVEIIREFESRRADAQRECERGLASLGRSADSNGKKEILDKFKQRQIELGKWTYQKLVDIQDRYGALKYDPLAYSYLSFNPESTDDERGIFELIHWERHGESLERTTELVTKHDVGALRRYHRTEEDYFRRVTDNGPIKPFKGDLAHRELLELILCFQMEPLTKEERADCADDYCPCGKVHDPGALDKQFRRLKKKLQASTSPEKFQR